VNGAYALGARLGLARLQRRPALVALLLAVLAVAIVSLLERADDRTLAVDRSLSGVAFGLALPLFSYACFELIVARTDLRQAVASLARHGQPRPALASGLLASGAAASALGGALLGALAVVFSQSFGHSRFAADLVAVLWIGALTGAAYIGLFALASRFRRGRPWLLVADWLLGSGTGFLALPWPRAHARNLLGFEPAVGLSQPSAVFCLLLLVVGGFFVASRGLQR
jgi:hypothetical protein